LQNTKKFFNFNVKKFELLLSKVFGPTIKKVKLNFVNGLLGYIIIEEPDSKISSKIIMKIRNRNIFFELL
jgi:hypothetical protein